MTAFRSKQDGNTNKLKVKYISNIFIKIVQRLIVMKVLFNIKNNQYYSDILVYPDHHERHWLLFFRVQ